MEVTWKGIRLEARTFQCGQCERNVSSSFGVSGTTVGHFSVLTTHFVYFCPSCGCPAFFYNSNLMYPAASPGRHIQHLPEGVEELYEEARKCMKAGGFTAGIMLFRKILMNVAVDKGARPNQTFQEYVNYIETNNLVPSGSIDWIDHIRLKGNEANHEIFMSSYSEASEVLVFIEHLLASVYEVPGKFEAVRKKNPGTNKTT